VVFFRRCALPTSQIKMIREYLAKGKPLVGVRTANHAMAVRGRIAEGHQCWDTFCTEVLGCGNYGYGPDNLGTDVQMVSEAAGHPILAGVKPSQWHSKGSLYLVKPLDKAATVLLRGSVNDKSEPVAWTRMHDKSRIFYTTLGHPDDFDQPQFRTLLVNGLFWAINPLAQ
jgi:type 1 glutamine amidotransferase